MKYKYDLITEQGKRKENQDNAAIFVNKFGFAMAVLADGMGGHIGGRTASTVAIKVLDYTFSVTDFTNFTDEEMKKWSEDQVHTIKKEMIALSQKNAGLDDMGTTLVFVIFGKNKLYITNIGDSRAYKIDGKNVSQLTVDQNYINSIDDPIKKAEIELTVVGQYLTSSLGPQKEMKIDFLIEPISLDDHIVLTCDGIHKVIPEKAFEKTLTSGANHKAILSKLIKQSIKHNSMDNMTAVSITTHWEDEGGL